MPVKFENPPISELVISTYFNPILNELRSEHVGLFWSSLKKEFPLISQNVPVGGIEIVAGSEIFPMPRFWITSEDEISLIQIQKNAFMFNWRRREHDYPHYDNLKAEFDRHFIQFCDFMSSELDIRNPNIDVCELAYINLVEPCEYWSGPHETKNILPSFSSLDIGCTEGEYPSFNDVSVYKMADDLQLRVAVRSAHSAKNPEIPALVFEIRATGRLGQAQKSDADKWFDRAHTAIINCFLGMTNPEIQHKYWKPIEEAT